ncbi:hypothetical protein D3C81_2087300 [compost metagenome]
MVPVVIEAKTFRAPLHFHAQRPQPLDEKLLVPVLRIDQHKGVGRQLPARRG